MTRCVACGYENNFARIKKVIHNPKSIFKSDILVCKKCGLGVVEQAPTQDQIISYYQDKYWAELPRLQTPIKAEWKNDFVKKERPAAQFAFVNKTYPNGGLNSGIEALEIGAGQACVAQYLRLKTGCKISVIEAGEQWIDFYIANKITLAARLWPLHPTAMEKKYDLILASHWLEHALNVKHTIRDFRKILKPEGRVFIEVPNCGDGYFSCPIGCSPHMLFFTAKSLKLLFESHGFETVKISRCGRKIKTKNISAEKAVEYLPTIDKRYLRAVFKIKAGR
jgi:2-polyprenyl-3-methyl-5-hydroxy-6-metoxy-1,4-benzoquinol methylase